MKSAKLLCFATICFLCYVACSLSPALAEDTTFVPLKELKEYTYEEWEILRNRWTCDNIEAVLAWLKGYKNKPSFVRELSPYRYDLREIRFEKQDLHKADLRRSCLQGAILSFARLDSADLIYANLQGAILWNTNLQGAHLTDANLKGASLDSSNLQGADLQHANLQGDRLAYARLDFANLGGVNLQGADLWNTNLQGAILSDANLQGAFLCKANLQRAYFSEANLQKAVLQNANLKGAHLTSAKLQDTDLFKATFDSTFLWQVNLGEAKNMRYITWGDEIENRYVIGEEKEADSRKSDEDFRIAEITYKDLKNFYKKELMDDVAGEFHYRENAVITKRYLRTKGEPLNYFWGVFRRLFLEFTYGYGSRSIWLLRDSGFIIILFFLIFTVLTIPRRTRSGIYLVQPGPRGERERLLTFRRGRLFLDCFYFSLLSFVTFGYGALQPKQWLQFFRLQPLEFKPVRWARIFVGIEAALGIWIFALLVTVLFGRG